VKYLLNLRHPFHRELPQKYQDQIIIPCLWVINDII